MNKHYCKKDTIYNQLKADIMSGKYQAGFKLPRETEFARELNVGQVTLRSALKRLEEEGYIARVHGKGTFIQDIAQSHNKSFLAVIPGKLEMESPTHHILPGIEQRCIEKNIKLTKCSELFLLNMTPENTSTIKQDYDGIIFPSNSVLGHEKDYLAIKATGLPTIMPHASWNDHKVTGFATMQTNEREAFSDVFRYLAGNGHSRVGAVLLESPIAKNHSRSLSMKDYIAMFDLNGLATSPDLLLFCQNSETDIKEKVKAIMDSPKPPTAFMCHSDFVAIHVYQALHELELIIPNHVAVMGYCCYPGGEFLSPPLSTVDLGFHDIGKKTVDILLKSDEWWGPDKAAPHIFTPYKILERKSTKIKRLEKVLV